MWVLDPVFVHLTLQPTVMGTGVEGTNLLGPLWIAIAIGTRQELAA